MPSLNWIGKKDIKNHHNHVEYRVIDCQETIGDPESGNLIVKGDNLLALKALLPYYAGEVKMIYIDPPYNTGNTSWVYNDSVDSPVIKKWLEKTVDSNDLSRSDKWLCMLYPRMKLLHQFLKEDGVIFISIDDAEVATLRLLMNEIFGAHNFIINFAWKKKSTSTNVEGVQVSSLFDNTLCYAKNINSAPIKRRVKLSTTREYPLNDSEGNYRTAVVEKKNSGDYERTSMLFEILGQKPREGKRWQLGEVKARALEKKNRFIINENGLVNLKIYDFEDHDTESAQPNLLDSHGTTDIAGKVLKNIFGKDGVFSNPKPIELIEHFIDITCNKNDIVLDSFAGSGTTGHAVLNYNKINGTKHKFVLIEMEEYAEEITKERVKRVVEGYKFTGEQKTKLVKPLKITLKNLLNSKFMTKFQEEIQQLIEQEKPNYDSVKAVFKDSIFEINAVKNVEEKAEGLGGGFQYCELSEPLLDEFGLLSEYVTFDMLAKHIYFTEFGIALTQGQISEENCYAGKFKDTELFIYIDKKFNLTELKKTLEKKSDKYLIFADTWSISPELLTQHNIEVKRLPLEIIGT